MPEQSGSGVPAVSVVMAVFNGEPYLQEAVDSILQQTFRDLELVVVDDGSTDDSWAILEAARHQDRRVVLLRNRANQGLIAALNRGVAAASASLVARMDADDVSHLSRIERQVEFLEKHPAVGLLGTGYQRLYPDGRITRHSPPPDHTTIRWRLLFGSVWPHPAVMFRRELLAPDEAPYGDFLHAEDYELWARLARRTGCATVEEPLLTVRMHDSAGVSAANRESQEQTVQDISREQIQALCLPGARRRSPDDPKLHLLSDPEAAARDHLHRAADFLILFGEFLRQPDIDVAQARRLRRSWMRRTLWAAVRAGRIGELLRSGFAARVLRVDPVTFLPPLRRGVA